MGVPSTNVVSRYADKSVWVTSGSFETDQTLTGSLWQVPRIQETTFSIPNPLQDNVNADSSVEAFNLMPAGVNVDIRLLNTNGRAEAWLGLAKLNPSGTLLLGLDEEKDLYIASQYPQGYDAIGAPAGA